MTQEENQEEKKNQQLKQVSTLYNKGQSFAKGGFFKSPDADEAEKLFKQAMKIICSIEFTVPTMEYVEWRLKLLEALAKVRYDMKFYLDAAKSLVEAYRLATDSEQRFNTDFPKIPQYCKQASEYYVDNKNYEKASDILLQAGKYFLQRDIKNRFDTDVETSMDLFDLSCVIQEQYKRPTFGKYFNAVVKNTLKASNDAKAIEFLEREIAMYELDPDKGIKRIWGRVTGIVLINYSKGQLDAAEIRYDQAVEKYSKLSNDIKQATLCKQFLEVFGKNDQDGLEKIKKSGDLGTLLPAHLAAFARNLNILT